MELTVKKSALLKELEVLQGVVERKNTVPVLANVLVSAGPEGVEVMATDLEISVRSRAEAVVRKPGGVSVSAKKLYEIVRLLPESDITLKDDAEHWVSLTCERSRFRIMGLSPEDYPTLPSAGKANKVKLPGALLKSMIEKVIFAVTSDDTRFALNGALMILKDGGITLVASDGHRLALVREKLEGKAGGEEEKVLIPRKALAEIARIAGGPDGDVFYCKKENHLFFDVGSRVLTSRLLEGTFPNFEKVVPVGNDKRLEFDRESLMNGLTRVSVLANERSRAIRLSVKSGKAEVSSRNPEMGDAADSLDVDYAGDDIEIGFNGKYLMDFLAVVGTEKVCLDLKNEETQGLMRPVDGSSVEYTYVVMPMRL